MALVVFVLLVVELGLVEVALPVALVGVVLVWFAAALVVFEEPEAGAVFTFEAADELVVVADELVAFWVLVGVASV